MRFRDPTEELEELEHMSLVGRGSFLWSTDALKNGRFRQAAIQRRQTRRELKTYESTISHPT